MRRVSLLMVLLLCGACERAPSAPAQRLPAYVRLKSDDVMVFVGQRAALRGLVAEVRDHSGTVLTDYELTPVLPVGWSVQNDTVIAPSFETVARLVVGATYLGQPSQAAAPAFQSASETGTTDTATVTSALDLKARRWTVSFGCSNVGFTGGPMGGDTHEYIDSMRVENAAVNVVYRTDSTWIPQYGGVAQLWVAGPATRWLRDGTVEPFFHETLHILYRQAPDSLVIAHRPDAVPHAGARGAPPHRRWDVAGPASVLRNEPLLDGLAAPPGRVGASRGAAVAGSPTGRVT